MKSRSNTVKGRDVTARARLFVVFCCVIFVLAVAGCDPRSLFNEKPVADAGEDISIILGSDATLDGSGSSDPESDALTYQWTIASYAQGSALRDSDIDGDTNMRAYVTPDIVGTYDFTLTVTDLYASSTDTVKVDVVAAAIYPIADAGVDQDGSIGTAVNFDASGSTIASGTIDSYAWDFGDSSTGAGITASHSYAANGVYTVTLTVTSDLDYSSTDTLIVNIGGAAVQTENLNPTYDIFVLPERAYVTENNEQLRYGIAPLKAENPRSFMVPALFFTMPSDFTGKTVSSAILTLYVRGNSGIFVPPDVPPEIPGTIIPITTTWTDTSATFTASWVDSAYSGAVDMNITSSDKGNSVTFNITALAQDWADGDLTNYGFAIFPDDNGEDISYYFDSDEYTARPTLEITYY